MRGDTRSTGAAARTSYNYARNSHFDAGLANILAGAFASFVFGMVIVLPVLIALAVLWLCK